MRKKSRSPYGKKLRRYRLRKKRFLYMVICLLFIAFFVFSARLLHSFQELQNTEAWAQSLRESKEESSGVNFLLIGLDRWGTTPFAERMVLIHESDAGHVNAVFIPGYTVIDGEGGDEKELLGRAYSTGGPKLLVEEVQELLGMPVHHYLSFHFDGLISVTDFMGEVPLDELPRGRSRELLPAGQDQLSGDELYQYFMSRAAHEESLEKVERQRRTLLYLQATFLERIRFWQIPRAVTNIASYIDTDLSWRELAGFYRLYNTYDYDDVHMFKIPGKFAAGQEGEYIPDREEIREMSRLIEEGLYVPPSMITVEVLNGCGIPGIANDVGRHLESKGFRVIKTDDADHFDYHYSQVISRTSQMELAKAVALEIPNADLLDEPTDDSRAQVTVIIGENYPVGEDSF